MEYIKIDKNKINKEDIEKIAQYLLDGKVVVMPTDTIYGFHCLAENEKALKKIYKIKNSKDRNGSLILVKSYCMLHDHCYVSKKQDAYIRSIWPKTTRLAQDPKYKHKGRSATFVLRSREKLPKLVSAGKDNLAVRMPKDEFMMAVLKKVNNPLISTSFNLSGKPVLDNFDKIEKYFVKEKPDLLVDGGRVKKSIASRLIDIQNIDRIEVIRS